MILFFLILFNLVFFFLWQAFITLSWLFFYSFFVLFIIFSRYFFRIFFFCFVQDFLSIKPFLFHYYILIWQLIKKIIFLLIHNSIVISHFHFSFSFLISHSHLQYFFKTFIFISNTLLSIFYCIIIYQFDSSKSFFVNLQPQCNKICLILGEIK